jgi:hypothetical protein
MEPLTRSNAVAALLLVNKERLSEGPRFVWPHVEYVWPSGAAERCRIALTFAALESFISDLAKNPTGWPNATAPLVAALGDDSTVVKELASAAIRQALTAKIGHDRINCGTKVLTRAGIQAAVDKVTIDASDESSEARDVEERIIKALVPKDT